MRGWYYEWFEEGEGSYLKIWEDGAIDIGEVYLNSKKQKKEIRYTKYNVDGSTEFHKKIHDDDYLYDDDD